MMPQHEIRYASKEESNCLTSIMTYPTYKAISVEIHAIQYKSTPVSPIELVKHIRVIGSQLHLAAEITLTDRSTRS